jgi:hypothetical protein
LLATIASRRMRRLNLYCHLYPCRCLSFLAVCRISPE